MENMNLADGLAWYVMFLLSITVHEAAHALAAKWGGDPTAFHLGQVSLNPIPHMRREVFGTIIMPILSFLSGGWMIGWASTPYSPAWAQRYPRRSALMALAGPIANFLLVLLFGLLLKIGLLTGFFENPAMGEGAWIVCGIGFQLNLLLFLFNLVPLPPLDGSSAITLLMPERIAYEFQELIRRPAWNLIGLLLAWQLFGHIYGPVYVWTTNLLF
jgi:Zn-dependent protease